MTATRVLVTGPERATEEGSGSGRISRETRYLLPVILPVVLAGFAAVIAAIWETVDDPPSLMTVAGVLALLAAALFSEAFPVPVENLPGGRLSLSTVFILGAAVLYGPSAAIFVALLTRVTLEIVERRPRIKLYYNGAVFALAAGAAGVAMTPFHPHDHAAAEGGRGQWRKGDRLGCLAYRQQLRYRCGGAVIRVTCLAGRNIGRTGAYYR